MLCNTKILKSRICAYNAIFKSSIKLRYEGSDSVLGQAWNAEQTGSHFTPLQIHFFHFDKGKNVHKHSSTWFLAVLFYEIRCESIVITTRSILDLQENFCDFERLLSEISEYIMLGDL